jgi:hypothetical protein
MSCCDFLAGACILGHQILVARRREIPTSKCQWLILVRVCVRVCVGAGAPAAPPWPGTLAPCALWRVKQYVLLSRVMDAGLVTKQPP